MNGTIHDYLKQLILENIPGTKLVSGRREITTRCIFCGDSKDRGSAHLYIGPFDNIESHPIFYHCMRCNEFGIMNSGLIRKLSYNINTELIIAITKYNKMIGSNPNNRFNKKSKSYILHNTLISDNENSIYKLKYINDRLGSKLTFDDCIRLKIIINLSDLLNSNGIRDYTRNMAIMQDLDKYFVGFLSVNNNFVSLRNLELKQLYEAINKRYIIYNIFNDSSNYGRYYIIPTSINLLSQIPIDICIAEGAFDILSVYLNINNYHNAIFCACLGKSSYINAIEYFVSDLGIINANFHIYIDNDVSDYALNNIAEVLDGLNLNLYIHKNTYPNEKDFGVPRDRIKESVQQFVRRV